MADQPEVVSVLERYRDAVLRRDKAQMREMAAKWVQVERNLAKSIQDLAEDVAKRRAAGEAISRDSLFRLERYRNLLAQADREMNTYVNYATNAVRAERNKLAQLGAEAANRALEASGARFEVDFHSMDPARVQAMAVYTSEKAPLTELLRTIKADAVDGASQALVDAMARGLGPRETARALRDGLGIGLTRAVTIARDQQMRAHRAAQDEAYKASGVVAKKKRLASKSGRTCIGCIARDGELLDIGEEAYDHVCGRCVFVPVIVGQPEPQWQSAREWFEGLRPEGQRAMLGPGRYKLWKSGHISLEDLAKTHTHKVWGKSVGLRTLDELRKLPPLKDRTPKPPPPPAPKPTPKPGGGTKTLTKTLELPVDPAFDSILRDTKAAWPGMNKLELHEKALETYRRKYPGQWDAVAKRKQQITVKLGEKPPEPPPAPKVAKATKAAKKVPAKPAGPSKAELARQERERIRAEKAAAKAARPWDHITAKWRDGMTRTEAMNIVQELENFDREDLIRSKNWRKLQPDITAKIKELYAKAGQLPRADSSGVKAELAKLMNERAVRTRQIQDLVARSRALNTAGKWNEARALELKAAELKKLQKSSTIEEARAILKRDVKPLQVKVTYEGPVSVKQKDGVRDFQELLGNRVTLKARSEIKIKVSSGTSRASYNDLYGAANLGSYDDEDTVVHELGHWFGYHRTNVQDECDAFFERRTVGETKRKLREVTGNNGYGENEVCKPDKFFNPYCGRVYQEYSSDMRGYRDRPLEIISMGLERMYQDPIRFMLEDEDYFDLIWGLIR